MSSGPRANGHGKERSFDRGSLPMAVINSFVSLAVGGALLCGCAVQHSARAELSILASSDPAAGSTARAPVDDLRLHFDPPARLDEISVKGPEGVMPAMVNAVGEVSDYSIPLSGLGPGTYTVDWQATAKGHEHHGTFTFTVR